MAERHHALKIWPEPFQAIVDGRKHHEVRVDDRGFAVGDVLHLREYEPHGSTWTRLAGETGREVIVRVSYITHGGQFGLPSNVCVMSIEQISKRDIGGKPG